MKTGHDWLNNRQNGKKAIPSTGSGDLPGQVITGDVAGLTKLMGERATKPAGTYDTPLTGTPDQALALFNPCPTGETRACPVSTQVNRPKIVTGFLVSAIPIERPHPTLSGRRRAAILANAPLMKQLPHFTEKRTRAHML